MKKPPSLHCEELTLPNCAQIMHNLCTFSQVLLPDSHFFLQIFRDKAEAANIESRYFRAKE